MREEGWVRTLLTNLTIDLRCCAGNGIYVGVGVEAAEKRINADVMELYGVDKLPS